METQEVEDVEDRIGIALAGVRLASHEAVLETDEVDEVADAGAC